MEELGFCVLIGFADDAHFFFFFFFFFFYGSGVEGGGRFGDSFSRRL